MKVTTAAAALFLAASTMAHAEPKTITLDGCAKVETLLGVENTQSNAARHTMTVKCTGESFDPEIRKPQGSTTLFNSLTVSPSTCIDAYGNKVSC